MIILLLMAAGGYLLSHFEEEKEAAKAHVTVSAKELKGENVDTVVDALYDMGFYDIDTKAEKDLVIGLVSKKDEVISVSINGDKKFKKGDAFENDVHVVVTYHDYKKDKDKK